MVKVPESFHAYMYQAGIDRIQNAFQISIVTLQDMQRQAIEAHTRYNQSGEDDSQYDDGCPIAGTWHELSHKEIEAGLALEVVREAFIISAFHYWERSARHWTGKNCFSDLKSNSPYLSHTQLFSLNTLNNLLKHGKADLALNLFGLWPALFSSKPHQPHHSGALHWRLAITDEIVEEAFEIVRGSGPRSS